MSYIKSYIFRLKGTDSLYVVREYNEEDAWIELSKKLSRRMELTNRDCKLIGFCDYNETVKKIKL